jgi:AcrR family transcriptional regulator
LEYKTFDFVLSSVLALTVPVAPKSTKVEIVLTAERLFAARGLEGTSLREIGSAAGNGNHSAVQYHFGSKEQLVEAIFEYRLPHLNERRLMLFAERQPEDLRAWLECYILPILEQGEEVDSHYLSFIATLQQSADRHLLDRVPERYLRLTHLFYDRMALFLGIVPEPIRTNRMTQVMACSVHVSADRERAQAAGMGVLPFAVHVADLLDGLVGFLEAPVSQATAAAIDGVEGVAPALLFAM